jgi:hypothetical protein
MSFYTVDPYYNIQFYNECKEALKNNKVEFEEFINIKAPYNWYFKMDRSPIMVNYDEATDAETRWMINVVKPLRPNEEYLLIRRDNDNGAKALLKFVENEPLRQARLSDYAVFFTVKNKEEVEKLTSDYPGKVWYFGKYYNNKYRVCLATHRTVRGFLDENQILLEKTQDLSDPGRFESELNFKVFRGNDVLLKFTETPYFEDGKYNKPKIRGDYTSKFNL